ncbi:MAG TPA: SGNH/GDSL hydrolase family protein [Gaiellaceae bacterium]|nr:SGNH/GDSL hydrolase family protein [Gaiellaceae bacterium]
MLVAVVGDSISAGSPLWPAEERSRWQWWAAQRDPQLEFRTVAAYGKRTDEIAAFLGEAVPGADALVVQGGINDIAQGRPVEDAARNLAAMIARGQELGLAVVTVDVLPWNNGDARAARDIVRLNELIHAPGVPVLPFHDTLVDPEQPERMRAECTDDGDHPSVEGHRLLGEQAFRLEL